MSRARAFLVLLLVSASFLWCVVSSGTLEAAGSAGSIRGTVVGPDGKPMAGVLVQLRNDISGFKSEVVSGADGTFTLFNIPFNPYELHVEVQGFEPVHLSLDVRTSIPLDAPVKLDLAKATASVTVQAAEPTAAQLETDATTSHIDIDKSFIARAPAPIAMRAMEEIVTSTPGFALDENGRYHFQGAHSQSEFVIDGQTISDQTGVTFSNSIDPGIAQSMEVIYGNVPAEYGEKIGAVINMTTKSGLHSPFKGTVNGSFATFDTYQAGIALGGGSDSFGAFGSFNAAGSNYFTDPVNPDNFNNTGNTQRLFIRLDAATPGLSNALRLSALLGQTHRGVTNTYTQEAAGQAQNVNTYDQNYNFGWQSVLSASSVLDVTAFGRLAKFTLYPSAGDTPITSSSNRSLDNYGITPSFTWITGVNEIKAGGVYKRYPIYERFKFGITDRNFNDPESSNYNPNIAPYDLTRGGTPFNFSDSRTGTYYAAYVQDTIRWNNLTANIGLRYENNNLPVTDVQLSPRIGLAYYIPSTGSVLRGTYSRILFTPEFENALLSSSQAAADIVPPSVMDSRALGGGELPVRSERQNAWTVGLQQALGSKLRLDFDYWWRRTTNAGDQDQFLNTGIVFPISFASGQYQGWDLRLDLAPTAGFRGFVSAGHVHAIYVPPPAGGLFLDQGAVDAITGGPFLIDHDQKLQVQAGVYYDLAKTGLWLGTNVRYDSGLVTDTSPQELLQDPDNAFAAPYVKVNSGADLDPNRIKPRTICDFQVGADLATYHLPFSVQFMVLNAFDVKGVYNILSVFGGTHVIPPRRFVGQMTINF